MEKFRAEHEQKGIQPGDLYNMDETGFRIGIGKDQWISTRDRTRLSYIASSNNRDLVTVIEGVSASGQAISPMIILPGIIHQEHWFTHTNLDSECLLATSESGYANDELSFEWLRHFDRQTRRIRTGAWRFLLLDGYASHCTYEFVQYCDQQKIIPFCLPPYTTHLLQPLDVVLFQPYKHWHAEAMDDATRTGCTDCNKLEFLSAINAIREKTFKISSTKSAFAETGLLPFDPAKVLVKLRESNPPRPVTPPNISDPHCKTPTTIRTLKRQASSLLTEVIAPTLRQKLSTFVKGSIAQASLGLLASEQLDRTKAAENARKLRQQGSRRAVQKGGVIYVHEARRMIHQRQADEVEKARAMVARAEAKEIRKQATLRKKVVQGLKKEYPKWTKVHQAHVNQMALL